MTDQTAHHQSVATWATAFEGELRAVGVKHLPDPHRAAALIKGLTEAPHPLAEHVGPVWTASFTRAQLGLRSRQALDSRRRTGSLLGVKASDGRTGEIFYPLFQFRSARGHVEVRPALASVFKILRDQDDWAVAMLMNSPAPELDGLTPLAWERAGRDSDELSHFAQKVRREWHGG